MLSLVTIKEYVLKQPSRIDGCLMISLPPVWVRDQQFSEGDTIEFLRAPNSNDLILRRKVAPPCPSA